ncbi:hypothetical protein G7067_11840 [Leucobacter insecticola]|uniref:Uncharacterized protein n=1 Tax=Leucobacter insecticola TaxID=2714934 RepID=A0A6G8FKP1_9MICO|nr:hypothetical protein [Leucobacter insecticola]QIM16935.1 hypothetical protein G7067_11840 [Leucobacter insecticola]
MRNKFLSSSVSAGLAVAMITLTGGVAHAGNSGSEQPAISSLLDAVPNIADQTFESTDIEIVETGGAIEVNLPEQIYAIEGLLPVQGATLRINTANSIDETIGGMTATSGDDVQGPTTVLQPTGAGLNLFTVINEHASAEEVSFTFNVPEGTVLIESGEDYQLYSDGVVHGTVGKPHAVDASGVSLPVSYERRDNSLFLNVDTQSVAVSYPIVAQASWGYTYQYDLQKEPNTARALLMSCFNCYFPVPGAPRSFPPTGAILPLNVAGFPFEVKMARTYTATNYFHFFFTATKNHIDGYGSDILFEFKKVGTVKLFTVTANVMNNSPWVNNDVYRTGALLNWALFVSNINRA